MIPKYIAYEYNKEGVLNRTLFIAEDDRLNDYIAYYKANILPKHTEGNIKPSFTKVGDATIISNFNTKPTDFEDPEFNGSKARSHIVRLDHGFMV